MSWSGRKGAVGGPDETIDYWGLAPNVLTEVRQKGVESPVGAEGGGLHEVETC